jgi:hypothetical protein
VLRVHVRPHPHGAHARAVGTDHADHRGSSPLMLGSVLGDGRYLCSRWCDAGRVNTACSLYLQCASGREGCTVGCLRFELNARARASAALLLRPRGQAQHDVNTHSVTRSVR